MFEKENGDKSPHSIEAGELRVVFDRRGDRYGHRIERRIDGAWHVVLESLEGALDEDWPASPVLQNLHIEPRSSGPVALLVGKAGQSHWSASIEPLSNQAGFQFDIACRVRQPPRQLGSTYQSSAAGASLIVDLAATSEETLSESVIHEQSTVVRIRPIELPDDFPSTVRWRYLAIPEATAD